MPRKATKYIDSLLPLEYGMGSENIRTPYMENEKKKKQTNKQK